MELASYVRDIPDFPKPGIIFKDITPLLAQPKVLVQTAEQLSGACTELLPNTHINHVIGIESRGFIFGPMLAERLQAGFIPVRKAGKLPGKTLSVSYDLEYGSDTLEMHADAIQPGQQVLIHDDILATGGTAAAVVQLVQQAGGIVVGCNFVIELGFLKGRQKLLVPTSALLHY